jgi:elongation factor Ts
MFTCASKIPSAANLLRLPHRNMASVASAALVKQLRLLTGSPIKDCMKALEQTNGDIEASKDYLRKKGLAEAEKRVDRSAAQGLVGVLRDQAQARITMVQLACETDFVAKTDRF